MRKISWIDLPQYNLRDILHEYETSYDNLSNEIQLYHRINKTQWKHFNHRIDALISISMDASNLSKEIGNSYLSQVAQNLSDVAKKKYSYLNQLLLLKEGVFEEKKQAILSPLSFSKDYTPLILNNVRKYNYKTEEIWGEYLIEAIDPCHRRLLNSYYGLWHRETMSEYLPDFFLWLEDKDLSVLFPSIHMFSPKALKQKKVTIKGGLFYDSKSNLITTKEIEFNDPPSKGPSFQREHIFIINKSEEIYFCYSGREIAHASLSHYQPLIGIGKLILHKGIIKRISFDSGHYLPRECHCIQAIDLLSKKGVSIDSQARLDYFNGHKYITTNVEGFMETFRLKAS